MWQQLLGLGLDCVMRLANQPGLGSSRALFLLGVRRSTAFEVDLTKLSRTSVPTRVECHELNP